MMNINRCFFPNVVRSMQDDSRSPASMIDSITTNDFRTVTEILAQDRCFATKLLPSGKTPLFFCMEQGSIDIARLLIAKGAHPNQLNHSGESPLNLCVGKSDLVGAALLLEHGADPNLKDGFGDLPLAWACLNNQQAMVRELIDWGADVNCALEHEPTDPPNDYYDVTRQVLETLNGRLAPMNLSERRELMTSTLLIELAASLGHWDIVRTLIHHGANVNECRSTGILSWATIWQELDCITELIELGCDVNQKDRDGYTPIYWASYIGHLEACRLLLEHKADPNVGIDQNGHNELIRACEFGHLEIVCELLRFKADPNFEANDSMTPFMIACFYGKLDVMMVLLKAGVDPYRVNRYNCSSLHAASHEGHQDIVRELLRKKFDINARDLQGQTPLSHAAKNGHLKIVKMLLESGADPEIQDRYGKKPINLGLERVDANGYQIVGLLFAHGSELPGVSSMVNQDREMMTGIRDHLREQLRKAAAEKNELKALATSRAASLPLPALATILDFHS